MLLSWRKTKTCWLLFLLSSACLVDFGGRHGIISYSVVLVHLSEEAIWKMPLFRRKPFDLAKPPEDLEPSELVYQVRFTKEIFRDYQYPELKHCNYYNNFFFHGVLYYPLSGSCKAYCSLTKCKFFTQMRRKSMYHAFLSLRRWIL